MFLELFSNQIELEFYLSNLCWSFNTFHFVDYQGEITLSFFFLSHFYIVSLLTFSFLITKFIRLSFSFLFFLFLYTHVFKKLSNFYVYIYSLFSISLLYCFLLIYFFISHHKVYQVIIFFFFFFLFLFTYIHPCLAYDVNLSYSLRLSQFNVMESLPTPNCQTVGSNYCYQGKRNIIPRLHISKRISDKINYWFFIKWFHLNATWRTKVRCFCKFFE